MKDKAYFKLYNWEDKKTRAIAEYFMLSDPPACILADKNGKVILKTEGPNNINAVVGRLISLVKSDKDIKERDIGKGD